VPQLNPANRFWAAIAAQGLAVMLLFLIGFIFEIGYTSAKPISVESGLQYIWFIAFLILIGLVVGFFLGFAPAHRCGSFEHPCVDKTVMVFLYCDIPLLTFLVCIQGGLSKSMFFPLFFLIPVAHKVVERDDRLDRVIRGTIAIGVGMLLCCVVSISVAYGVKNPFSKVLSVTDYSTLTPARFAFALFLVSLISLLIPILQMKIIRMPEAGK
jgi:hypothetical protein